MSFYGYRWLKNEVLEEQVILQEMNFSKKDLQDPKTIDKIIKRKDSFESVNKFIAFLFIGLSVGSGIALQVAAGEAGFAAFVVCGFILGYLKSYINTLPLKFFKQNEKKYYDKLDKLKSDTEKKLKEDPKNKEKYQKILSNIDEVIKEIKKREELTKKERFMNEVEVIVEIYKDLVKWLDKPFVFGHTGDGGYMSEIMSLAKELKIPEKVIIDKIYNDLENYKDYTLDEIIPFEDGDSTYEKLKSLGLSEKNIPVKEVSSDDEVQILYLPSKNKFIYTDNNSAEFTTPYKIAKEKFDKNALIEADKQMGYYLLSECPEQVKKKKLV